MSEKDDCLYEVLNPIDDNSIVKVLKMAYDVLNVVTLLCIGGERKW